jgi:hypothetical protein
MHVQEAEHAALTYLLYILPSEASSQNMQKMCTDVVVNINTINQELLFLLTIICYQQW